MRVPGVTARRHLHPTLRTQSHAKRHCAVPSPPRYSHVAGGCGNDGCSVSRLEHSEGSANDLTSPSAQDKPGNPGVYVSQAAAPTAEAALGDRFSPACVGMFISTEQHNSGAMEGSIQTGALLILLNRMQQQWSVQAGSLQAVAGR
jgi:hypothetical protein